MRWLVYYPDEPWEKSEDFTRYSLQELYEMQDRIEKELYELRMNEPSAKRKNEDAHKIWFSMSQGYLADLRQIRDAIFIVKERENTPSPEQ